MSGKISFYLTKKGNKLTFDQQQEFLRWQQTIPEGAQLRADFIDVTDRRDDWMNRMYWGVLEKIEELENDVEITKEVLHDYFKFKFLAHKEQILGEEITEIPESKTLSKKKFKEYMERVINWCIQKHGVVPVEAHWQQYWETL
jgi:hypothetical protein